MSVMIFTGHDFKMKLRPARQPRRDRPRRRERFFGDVPETRRQRAKMVEQYRRERERMTEVKR